MSPELSTDPGVNTGDLTAGTIRVRSRLLWAVAAALVLLLLVLTPPLLKLNRYARGIALSMSQSLGRPVHLDNVSLGLFPVPHLTLQNVVVSEDPAFGSEPIIRANVVEANLRASSLWRRPMEFSRVRFVEPSVNLVRNGDGRWNLEGVLVHASQVDTAPTAQQHRGSAPRFPYIEATGGRVNIKIGEEKKPFSLTDTDFALWLPSPEQWSIRLTGTPARTDTNLNDPGVFRIEGSLQRAAHMGQVPVTLHATWRNAPLGEATRLLTGVDKGWRGTVQVDASLKGSLGASRLASEVTVDDLRRADFVPSGTLSLHLRCVALADVPAATLRDLSCNLPDGAAQPLRLQAETVDLSHPFTGAATLQAEAVPLEWMATWARLLSVRFPPTPLPGTLDATLSRGSLSERTDDLAPDLPGGRVPGASHPPLPGATLHAGSALSGWIGSLVLHLPLPPASPTTATAESLPAAEAPSQTLAADVLPGTGGDSWRVALPPSPLRLSPESVLSVSGAAVPAGYTLHVTGQASPARLAGLASRLPPLGDGLAPALDGPALPGTAIADTPTHLDLTCSRGWSAATGDQTCSRAADLPRKPSPKSARRLFGSAHP